MALLARSEPAPSAPDPSTPVSVIPYLPSGTGAGVGSGSGRVVIRAAQS